MTYIRFTEEQKYRASSVDLGEFLRRQGQAYEPAPRKREEPKKEFIQPPAGRKMRHLYAYFLKKRLIDREVLKSLPGSDWSMRTKNITTPCSPERTNTALAVVPKSGVLTTTARPFTSM
ncbi:hypothetical protein [Muriventricola aceti]|uniref:hypothetical protein n=1 Tax=Muriventricola aceti TaxID=2981773 RepID=UPI0021D05069|nr:hypothetical protein [Muriventricola aceti]MCU6704143.1 hypothetical protein [Muriventricola aceti]